MTNQTVYQGTLSNTSSVYGGVSQASANYIYEAIQVIPATTGTYVLTSTSTSNLKLYGYLYDTNFTVTSPLTNLIARDDSSTTSLQFSVSSALTALREYVLVVTAANQSSTGSFNITASGPGVVGFSRRNIFSQNGKPPSLSRLSHICHFCFSVTYGQTLNNGVDDGTDGFVTINLNDVITGVDGTLITGYVNQVSMSFIVAPTVSTASIYIYVMNRVGSTFTFTPVYSYQIPTTSISATTGVQTYAIPRNQLPVVTGQYVALGMGTTSGSLPGVANKSQCYLATTNFASLAAATYTNATNGIAFLYQVYLVGVVQG